MAGLEADTGNAGYGIRYTGVDMYMQGRSTCFGKMHGCMKQQTN